MPLVPDPAWVEEIRDALPPLPAERRARLAAKARVDNANEAVAIAVERGRDALASAAIDAGGDPSRVLVHLEHNLPPDGPDPVTASALAALTQMEKEGRLTATQAKQVLADLVEAGGDGDPAAHRRGGASRRWSPGALESAVDECHRRATRRVGQVLRGRGQGRRRRWWARS